MAEKQTKQAVAYEAKAHDRDHRCGLCAHFMPLYHLCHKVQGKVNPTGWCRLFQSRGK